MKLSMEDLGKLQKVAQVIFESGVCPPDHKRWEATFAVMAAGAEMDYGPMQSIRLFQIVKGKVAMIADAQIAMCVREGSVCEYFRLVESTDKRAIYETKRKGAEPTQLAYTIAQAERANLVKPGTWTNHTEAMLRARCAAALARIVYPDLVAGIYEKGEAEEIARDDVRGEVVAPPAQLPPPAPANEAKAPTPSPATDPIKNYSARIAAVGGLNELVAVHLELAHTVGVEPQRTEALSILRGRRKDLGVGSDEAQEALDKAMSITREPGAWATMAKVFRAYEGAADVKTVRSAGAALGPAVMKLPLPLQSVATKAYEAKLARLESIASARQRLAAQIEDEIRRADTIDAANEFVPKMEQAFREGRLTKDQLEALVGIHDTRLSAIEREIEQAGMRLAV